MSYGDGSANDTVNNTLLTEHIFPYTYTTVGDYTAECVVVDRDGNSSNAIEAINSTAIPPTITIYDPQNIVYNSTLLPINITASDANLEDLWYSINGGANSSTTDTGSIIDTISWTPGNHVLEAWANDTAGNIGYANVSFSIVIPDTTNPVVRIIEPMFMGYNSTIVPVDINATDDSGVIDSIWYNLTDVDTGASILYTNATTSLNLIEGHMYTLEAFANDTAGNVGTDFIVFWIMDMTNPTINWINYSAQPTIVGNNITFTANITDNYMVNPFSVVVEIDGNPYFMYPGAANDTYEFIWTSLNEGTFNYTVYAEDAWGNNASMNSTFTVIPVPPGTIEGYITDSSTGFGIAGADVTATIYGVQKNTTVTVGASGYYTLDVPPGTDYVISVDMSGYTSGATTTPIIVTSLNTTQQNLSLDPAVLVGTLEGTVSDGTNNIYGAIVKITQGAATIANMTTNDTGEYSFDLIDNEYNLTIIKEGFEIHTEEVSVFAGSTTIENVQLTPLTSSGRILGTVFDGTAPGTMRANARIEIRKSDTGDLFQVVYSNNVGDYQVNGLPPTLSFTYSLDVNPLPSGFAGSLGVSGININPGETETGWDIFLI